MDDETNPVAMKGIPSIWRTDFPHAIYDDNQERLVREEDIAKAFFSSMNDWPTDELLKCRRVSPEWREGIDQCTNLWDRMDLTQAVRQGRIDICRLVVEYAPIKNHEYLSVHLPAIHLAAHFGHLDIFKLIADQFEDVNPPICKDGITPLHRAASKGHLEVVKYITEKINDKNPGSKNGTTPLHRAAAPLNGMNAGHLGVIAWIMDRVVDKNPANDYGATYSP